MSVLQSGGHIYRVALKSIRWIYNNNWDHIYPSIERQRQVFAQLPENLAGNAYPERAYSQYRAQCLLLPLYKRFALHALSLCGLIPLGLFAALSGRVVATHPRTTSDQKKRAVFFRSDLGLIPESLNQEFEIVAHDPSYSLHRKDLELLVQKYIKPHPTDFYFHFKLLFKLVLARGAADSQGAEALIVCNEFSFTNSFITHWAEESGLEHINVMHGEKLYNVIDAYSSFHRFYFWDEHYRDLFASLKLSCPKTFIEPPPSFARTSLQQNEKAPAARSQPPKPRLTCYLQNSDEQELSRLKKALDQLKPRHQIRLRPHPRFSDFDKISKLFPGYEVEAPDVSIHESLADTDYALGIFTTVLYQAWLSGCQVIVDDISNPDFFKRLSDLEYIMLSKPHKRLSDTLSQKPPLEADLR